MSNNSTNIKSDFESPKYGKLTRRYINPAIIAVSINSFIGIIVGAVYNLPLFLLVGFVSSAELISLLLLHKAASRTIITPDLEFNYGFGKYEDLSTISTSLILLISLGYFIYSGIMSTSNLSFDAVLGKINHHSIFLNLVIVLIVSLGYAKHKLLQRFYSNSHLTIFKNTLYKKSFMDATPMHYFPLLVFNNAIAEGIGVSENFTAIIMSLIFIVAYLYRPLKNLNITLNNLLDKNLPEPILFDFLSVIIENFNKMCEYKSMRTRQSGEDIFVEIDVVLPYDFTISQAYELELSIKKTLQEKYPNAIPKIYAIPCVPNCVYMQKGSCPVNKIHNVKEDLK